MTKVKIHFRACALQPDLRAFLQRSQEMQTAMRQLRRNLEKCQVCEPQMRCAFREQFNQQVALAIQEINDEYHLAQFFQ
jgi:hypothetical protein